MLHVTFNGRVNPNVQNVGGPGIPYQNHNVRVRELDLSNPLCSLIRLIPVKLGNTP